MVLQAELLKVQCELVLVCSLKMYQVHLSKGSVLFVL